MFFYFIFCFNFLWVFSIFKSIHSLGGSGLLQHKYASSPSLLIMAMYPEYSWVPWEFEHVPKGYWDDLNFHRKFLERISKQLKIKENGDWTNVHPKVMIFSIKIINIVVFTFSRQNIFFSFFTANH